MSICTQRAEDVEGCDERAEQTSKDQAPIDVRVSERDPPNDVDLQAWRLWMRTVFMPLNIEMERLILSNMDLLVGDTVEPSLIELCAHVEAYKTVLARWDAHDLTVHAAPMNFPGAEVDAYARRCIIERDQKALLELVFTSDAAEEHEVGLIGDEVCHAAAAQNAVAPRAASASISRNP
jgi:hypothetical protein